MSFRYLKILLVALGLVFISQGCFPPPPPYPSRHHHYHDRRWHRSSLEQPQQSMVQLANRNGEDLSYQGEVAK